MQTLDIGEVATLVSSWANGAGEAMEPSAITLTITKPDGTVISKAKADLYQGATTAEWLYDQTADAAGAWRYQFEGVVSGQTVIQPAQVMLVGADDGHVSGPCEPWCTWEQVTACTTGLDTLTAAQRESAIDQASEILFNLSGRTYTGICTVTRSLCISCAVCAPCGCSCTPSHSIDLGGGRVPVWAAWDVVVDGVTLPPSAYTIVGRRWLRRLDGESWPLLDPDDPGSFYATWAAGARLPAGAQLAAARFAAEIARSCAGLSCNLPARITNVAREGVTFTILDSQKFLDEGRTGIYLVDAWLISDRKGKSRPGLFVPGARGGRTIARTPGGS